MNKTIVFIIILTSGIHHLSALERPEPPAIKYVSVDPFSNNILIHWDPSPSPDIISNVIYIVKNNSNFQVDSIFDMSRDMFMFSGGNPDVQSETFTMAAYNSSLRISTISEGHSTIHVQAEYDSCSNKIMVSWTPYEGWGNNIRNYNIKGKYGLGSYRVMGQALPDENTFTIEQVQTNKEYCIYIEAIHTNGNYESTSNLSCITTTTSQAPDYINADYATVIDNSYIELSFTVDSLGKYNDYTLMHSIDDGETFNPITTITTGSNKIEIIDSTSNLLEENVYYLGGMNNCGGITVTSNNASNIVLAADLNNNYAELDWNRYNNWLGDVGGYNVFRITSDGKEEQIASDMLTTAFTDNLSEIASTGITGNICYRVEAYEARENRYGIKASSISNTACLTIVPQVFFPNAFTPNNDGLNDIFKPLFSFLPRSYYFSIADKWGRVLFETDNHGIGWDGTIKNNEKAMEGVYVYYLRLVNFDGSAYEYNGNVMVILP